MRQEEIENEIWRNVYQIGVQVQDEYGEVTDQKLTDLGQITAWFGPNPEELDLERSAYFETEGDPPLEMYVIPRLDEKLIDIHVTRIGRSTVYLRLSEGTFPKPVRLGLRTVRWRIEAIEAWRDSHTLSSHTGVDDL